MDEVQDVRDVKKIFVAPAIKSYEHYDFSRAKICCSLTWLVAKAYGTDSIPADLRDPFYTDQYDQEHLKPPVASLLLSADFYCRAGSLILKSDAAKPLLGHDAVIQTLAERGLYVTDQERLVTERDLRKRPLQMSAHLAMIDTLMMAYTLETVSAEKVISCIQQYSSCSPEVETPYDTEDAITTWINKINEYLKDIMTEEQRKKDTQSAEPAENPRARYRKEQASTQPIPWIPPVDNLLKDNTDGAALGALLHFYCPQLLSLDDVCLKENMTLADRLYNLQLIQDFCKDNLNSCCHFSLEDMLYASSTVKNNYLAFMAELFCWFEVVKPSFVKPRHLDSEGTEPFLLKNMPVVPISKATKRSFMERPPSPERPSLPLRPQPRTSGEIKRSTSMSFVDGNLGTWPKEKRSGPYGVSFDIPFDKDDYPAAPLSSSRGMVRSVSTDDGSGFKVHQLPRGMKRNLSFQPVNGQSVGINEEGCPDSLAGMEPGSLPAGGVYPSGHRSVIPAAPSMEEALKIIHSSIRPPVEGINNGFFLHSQDHGLGAATLEPVSELESKESVSTTDTTEVDTGIHIRTEDMLDEDSSLKDCSVNMELDMDTPSPCPSSQSKSPSGMKMTSFAEQKKKKLNPPAPDSGRGSSSSLKTTPEGSEFGLPLSVSWAPTPEHSPIRQQNTPPLTAQASPTPIQLPPNDPAQAMATEMVQLRMRLEEKRKAIEAQKKKVEAAFTRHRQRMGQSAFLTVVKRKGDGAASGAEEEGTTVEEKGMINTSPTFKMGRNKADTPDGAEQGNTSSCWPKLGGEGEEGGPNPAQLTEVDLAEYTRSIEKLNHSLAFLQTEMQRLAQQQEIIMAMREQKHQQAWVIPAPHTSPSSQKQCRTVAVTRSSGPSSPADSPHSTHRSPTSIKRKSASFHSRNPRTPRPSELKLAPYSRVLTAPQCVDNIPRLRRFSPCQPLADSFIYMGEKLVTDNPETVATNIEKNMKVESLFSSERELAIACVANSPPLSPTCDAKQKHKTVHYNAQTQENIQLQTNITDMDKCNQELKVQKPVVDLKPTVESTFAEVLAQPVIETFTVTPTANPPQPGSPDQAKSSLIEVPLSILKPLEDLVLEDGLEMQPGCMEGLDDDQKMCRGFFFKEEGKAEENMAQKRAVLLEKRMRREKESQQRKMQIEAELEQKKEEARLKAEEERIRKEEDKARREFIKQEYLRRKQLKLMEDMDTVIKSRPASGAKQRRSRPKSIHRDSMDSPKTPIRAATGSCQRVFSVSSLSLASLNLGDSDSVHSEKRASRSASLAPGGLFYFLSSPNLRRRRPDSADGCLSPSRSSSRNGEKDWENASTTSSVTSNTEYTGPKLYKEPSAKSNKHIIQNALSHCCLAGKVNETQKNKILEEMEKSEANNFLVLFRDGGCQFRALYTYCPETEEINKLAGIGPKGITRKMIDGLYKYNSDKKQFSQIPAKTMSASVDAVTIHSHLWQTKKPATPKKVVPAQS
ncbi:calmodulin-regulated spectrin-associated protein 2a isoform X3 [Thalassophryne amazonica]|uniref:calmodulin-regulated spectrin-associated protein 2a isoform X3 n=1 Tax=Thalassophryne amazonica TaxID=390379 RepID=UPI001470A130|nr:calmodulin-regulated spectrin-associated protein 2a isoform X3 [Thalassophryne amazonica]